MCFGSFFPEEPPKEPPLGQGHGRQPGRERVVGEQPAAQQLARRHLVSVATVAVLLVAYG